MKKSEINQFIKKHWLTKTNAELAKLTGLTNYKTVSDRGRRLGLPSKAGRNGVVVVGKDNLTADEQIQIDKDKEEARKSKVTTDKKYHVVLSAVERLQAELEAVLEMKAGINSFEIPLKKSSGNTPVTAVVLASDWHIEEIVKSEKVNGLNEFNLSIAQKRIEEFFQHTLKLIEKEKQNAKIETLVLALLGDFISGNIHEELLENCSLRPIEAIIEVQNQIVSGIHFLLRNSKLNLVIPCHVGNHTRITKKVHISTEQGNNLEYFMYHNLANYFRGNKRVTFLIADGYLSYVKVYDFMIRFHHGHAMKYGGGIGGLFIPTFKAISQWQKMKHADLDCFGHFHQFKDGGNFICNGSIIGYNSFALQIKADYETPRQTFFLIDSKRGCKTVTTPILFSV